MVKRKRKKVRAVKETKIIERTKNLNCPNELLAQGQ